MGFITNPDEFPFRFQSEGRKNYVSPEELKEKGFHVIGGCPHQRDMYCKKLSRACKPASKGCVLRGRAISIESPDNEEAERKGSGSRNTERKSRRRGTRQ